MNNLRKRRRQVAWICFEPYLNEQQLLAVIHILEVHYQFDSVTNLIAFISKICKDFEIDAATRKSLYVQFHELMLKEVDDAYDPLEPVKLKPAEPAVSEVKAVHSVPVFSSSSEQAVPVLAEISSPAIVYPAYVFIFAELMRNVIKNLSDQQAFFTGLKELLQDNKIDSRSEFVHAYSWFVTPDDFQWALELTETKLAELVHMAYTVLCDLSGPIKADETFHKALVICEQAPQAKEFRPSRFF